MLSYLVMQYGAEHLLSIVIEVLGDAPLHPTRPNASICKPQVKDLRCERALTSNEP